jgi:hypothetical protein
MFHLTIDQMSAIPLVLLKLMVFQFQEHPFLDPLDLISQPLLAQASAQFSYFLHHQDKINFQLC